jgi:hypothetical protein
MKANKLSRRMAVLRILSAIFVFYFVISGCKPSAFVPATETSAPAAEPTATETSIPIVIFTASGEIPYDLISAEPMLDQLEVLTNIRAFKGFRTSGTTGEAEAFDYVEDQLNHMTGLLNNGMQLERQQFDVLNATQIHETGLFLTGTDGKEIEVKVNGLRGSRYSNELALVLDSDGELGDLENDPLTARGKVVLVRDQEMLRTLDASDNSNNILFVDEQLLDAFNNYDDYRKNRSALYNTVEAGVAGLVLVSEYSNQPGETHGALFPDGVLTFKYVNIPILHARIEDVTASGIDGWEELGQATSARVVLDSDIISPAPSGNLIAHIPGVDSTHAMIVSAHLDSPNTPGGFDDGSGVVVLMELARVLNEAQLKPQVDLWLVWYGGHENGMYGSAHFAATHSELMDQALAQLQVDCLGLPLEGNTSNIVLDFNSYASYGDDAAAWQEYLAGKADELGISLEIYDEYGLIADNSNFDTWNVPEADMIYYNTDDYEEFGNGYIHYSNHLHDPYESVELVSQVSDVLVNMAKVALTAAIQTGRDLPALRTVWPSGKRALFVASHSEPPSMMTSLRELGMALAWEGFDVDALPYGEAVTSAALQDSDLVVLLPTIDWPGDHDETWSTNELDALDAYVEAGGLLVVTNSEYAHIMTGTASDPNEDDLDINTLLEPMGAVFLDDNYSSDKATSSSESPLSSNARTLYNYQDAGVVVELTKGEEIYRSGGKVAIALLEYGDQGGQVVVIGDLGLLIDEGYGASNLQFLKNLAAFARDR